MRLFNIAGAIAALALSFTAATPAKALEFLLNETDAMSGLPAPYGKVTVIQSGANALTFTIDLFDGLKFTDTGAHYAFAFSLDGVPTLTFNGPTGFSLVTNSNGVANSPFGAFDYGVACTVCDPNTGGYAGPLVFTISATVLTLNMLASATNTFNGQSILFAADAISPTGITGTVGGGTAVPEPATWAMMILGFAMVGAGLRLRRRPEPTIA
jgi:hypothetical protein